MRKLSGKNPQPDVALGYQAAKSAEEVLRRYSDGERFFQGTDLPEGASFQKADLSRADFSDSWMSGVDFRSANLQNVRFDKSNVKCSDFRNGDLTGASFRGALLYGATFAEAKLDNVCTEDATWYGATVTDIRVLAKINSTQ